MHYYTDWKAMVTDRDLLQYRIVNSPNTNSIKPKLPSSNLQAVYVLYYLLKSHQ